MKWLKYSVSATIAVTFSVLLLLFGRSIVGNLMGINENFYLKYYYDIINGKDFEKWNYNIPDSLTIFNIQNYRSRHDIAEILKKVYDLNPTVIGLDVFFADNADVRESTNTELISAIKKVQDKLVIPCKYTTDSLGAVHTVYPFFYNVSGLENVTYASPVAHEYYGYYTMDDSAINSKFPGDSILPRIDIAIARKSRMGNLDNLGNFYVNYSKKDFTQIIYKDTLDIRASMIQDNVVLIGDLADIKDISKLPFRFGSNGAISGIEDIAYSLICIQNQLSDKRDDRMRMNGFQDCSSILNYLVAFFLAWLFSLFLSHYAAFMHHQKEKGKLYVVFALILQPLTVVAVEIFTVFISYTYTYFTNQVPDLFLSMVAIALVSISNEITKVLIPTK